MPRSQRVRQVRINSARNNTDNYIVVPELTYDEGLDPLNMTDTSESRQARQRAESVLSPYHPRNQEPTYESTRFYTFRQRNARINLTLGWELEANHGATRPPHGVEVHEDGSVEGEGLEYVVLPAVTKSPRYVLGLLKDMVHAPRLNTDRSCGFHVHVSASNVSSLARMRQWALATEHLALQVEDLAFKAVPDSRRDNTYCKRIVPLASGTSFNAIKYNNARRYHWLNTVEMFRPNGIRTIENRLLGHTHRWKYVLAWSLFTMELAQRGWELSNHPFERDVHVDALGAMLKEIAKSIKPLEKRNEPIPSWVYSGLKNFGIEANAWDRPLARLVETEHDLNSLPRPFYSDNQVELPNESEEESDDDYCPCGCGDEGRCERQLHRDSDCDPNYCYQCHENGNCDGLPSCDYHVGQAHDDNEYCDNDTCTICARRNLIPRARAPRVATAPRSNVTVNPSGARTGRVTASGLFDTVRVTGAMINTSELQRELNRVIEHQIDASVMTTYTGILHPSVYNEFDMYARADRMCDQHETAMSENREYDMNVRMREREDR